MQLPISVAVLTAAFFAILAAIFVASASDPIRDESILLMQTGAACDSKEVVGRCTATITVEGRWAAVRTNTPRCAHVDWYRDGQPQTTVVRGGLEQVELLGKPVQELSVASCTVIKDLLDADVDQPLNPAVRGEQPRRISLAGSYGKNIRITGEFDLHETGASGFVGMASRRGPGRVRVDCLGRVGATGGVLNCSAPGVEGYTPDRIQFVISGSSASGTWCSGPLGCFPASGSVQF